MQVITKTGKHGTVTFDDRKQTATLVDEDNVSHLIAYMRNNKVKVKSDLHLNDVDMANVRQEMRKYIKSEQTVAKKKNRR